MDADWSTSPSARRVMQHAADTRPAWLWSQDGQRLIWANAAAGLFLAKLKKSGLKVAPAAVPIKGQVARNIRLGSPGRTSLARIQFQAGDKPTSSTCATTPLIWEDGQPALLIVGVDPIADDIVQAARDSDAGPVDDDVTPIPETTVADAGAAPEAALASAEDLPHPDEPVTERSEGDAPAAESPPGDEIADWSDAEDHATADVIEPTEPAVASVGELIAADETAYARELESWREAERDGTPVPVADVDHDEAGSPAEAVDTDAPIVEDPPAVETAPSDAAPASRLSLLVDRLAADDALYAPLTDADDAIVQGVATPPAQELYQVTGRGFVADEPAAEETEAEADLPALQALDAIKPVPVGDDVGMVAADDASRLQAALAELAPKAPDADTVERVSRYNFDELSRILNDRVGDTSQNLPKTQEPQRTASLVNLGGETLVLNRLPLGILVFRDQQVLFANRAVTEMVGYDSVEQLREAGLAAVFPAGGSDGQGAGPVNHLVQRDGTLVPVTARLQSISWQGRPALMLSASATEVRTGHEQAVNAFAQTLADVRGDGFFEATRTGVVSGITQKAASLLGQEGPLEGKPLTGLIAGSDVATLREFLDRPARFAETARPCLTLRSVSGKAEIIVFAQGQAGVVTGYFGFVRGRDTAPVRISTSQADADPALLGRIGRGVRRPLNTIMGFSELLRSGMLDAEKLEGYARDIGTAGQEIAALVDELEDYARLRDGRYLPQRSSIELTALLESCVVRIRQQASSARVFVRNAISETLPRVTADRASLEQAVLNLLASAIDQTPTGGAVVISAQREDDGAIAIHVRDSSNSTVDMAERFVVFRDGVGKDGQLLAPVRSSVGLALTRSLLAVNAFSLSVDPAGELGLLFTLVIPADLVEKPAASDVAE